MGRAAVRTWAPLGAAFLALAWAGPLWADGATTEVALPAVKRTTQVEVTGRFVADQSAAASLTAVLKGLGEEVPVACEASAAASPTHYTFKVVIDFGAHVEGETPLDATLAVSSDAAGRFEDVKVSRNDP